MSENKNHNDPLEKLFKRKAEEYDITFREEDWNSLEQKLDIKEVELSYRRKIRWLAAAAVLVISLLGYFTLENYNRLNLLTDQLAEQIENDESDSFIIPELPTSDRNQNVTSPNHIADNQVIPDQSDNNIITGFEMDEQIAAALPDNEFEETGTNEVSMHEFTGELTFSTISRDIGNIQDISVYNTEIRHPAGVSSMAVDASKSVYLESDFDPESSRMQSSKLSIGFLASPDMSAVGSVLDFYNPGYKFGVTVEYSISQNISVSTGIMQSMVRYSAHGSQYNTPVYWQNGIVPQEIIAECLLLDIPVTFKFNFLNFDRSRFFATAGLSSYIMQNEEYNFSYNEESTGQPESWNGKTGTRHWFSNAGLSIGYELDIHPKWSLRAEPFMKIPIKEIGWGNVKLYSMGSFVSLNYRL